MTNWAAYEAGLRARGSLTVWFSDEAIEGWRAEVRTGRGGQPRYSSLAILTALTLRAVFRLALRQTEGLIASVLRLLGLDLAVPGHSTLMWTAGFRQSPFAVLHHPLVIDHGRRPLPRPHRREHRRGVRGSASSMRTDAGSLSRACWRKIRSGAPSHGTSPVKLR